MKRAWLMNSALNFSPSFSRSSTAQATFIPLAAALRRPLQAESWPCCVSPSHTHPAWSSLWILAPSSPVTAWTCASPTARAGETEKCNRSRPLTFPPVDGKQEEYHSTVARKKGGKGNLWTPGFLFSHCFQGCRAGGIQTWWFDWTLRLRVSSRARLRSHQQEPAHMWVSVCVCVLQQCNIFNHFHRLPGSKRLSYTDGWRIKAKSSIKLSAVVRTPSVHLGL